MKCLKCDAQVDNLRCINIGMKNVLVGLVMHLNCNYVVMGSNLGLNKMIFLFVKT